MNSIRSNIVQALTLLVTLTTIPSSRSEVFVQGSAINVPAGSSRVYDLPADGVLNCASVDVAANAFLAFNPNALNTAVFLVATSDVRINGRIFVNGAPANVLVRGMGGPGGFPGGWGGIPGGHGAAGNGAGPGGGINLSGWLGGVFGFPMESNTNVYGNALLYPLIGGSGGSGRDASAGGFAGGGGGGAILIWSQTRIELSNASEATAGIYARGGAGGVNLADRSSAFVGGGGSGGAIRLVAPIVTGTGRLDTGGGLGGYYGCCNEVYNGVGSLGRIRIDCLDDYAFRGLTINGSFSRGAQMFWSRLNAPRLDVVEAAGLTIPFGVSNAVAIALDFGSPSNQLVKIRAENFTNNIPIRIAVTPDTGPSRTFDGVITNTGSPTITEFNVVIPPGTVSRIDAWTR